MKPLVLLLGAIHGILLDPSSHTQIQWTLEEQTQPYREFDITPLKIFGNKEFSKIYVNGYGTVSFDMPQLGIVDSQTFTDADLHKIIFAPYWAAVNATTVVHVSENGIGTDDAIVNPRITALFGRTFTATTLFTASWVLQNPNVAADPKTFQVIITSDGYFSYAIFSYDNGAPTWTVDDDDMTPVSGILAHHRRSDLCMKTVATSGKDQEDGDEIAWNIYDDLDCTDVNSFTECGDMKQEESAELGSMNLQYYYEPYYRSTTISLYAFTWEFYAMVTCNQGFQIDAAGNNKYKRDCIYDTDFYESEWTTPVDQNTGTAYVCTEMEVQNVQINIVTVTIEVFPPEYAWLLLIDPTKLSVLDSYIWQAVFQHVFTSILSETYNIQVSIHVTNIFTAPSSRRRRNVVDALQTLVNEGLLDPSTIASISNLQEFLEGQAEAAGATSTTPVIDTVDFVIGFDEQNVTSTEVQDAIVEVLNNIQNATVTTLPNAIQVQIPVQIQEMESSLDCLGKGTRNGNNPHWIRPDTCCANRPYNRNYLGCCTLTNGHKRVYDIANDLCCNGVITANGTHTNTPCV